jgi:ketosteroid isomerase-like protein
MGSQENIKLVQEFVKAMRDRDEARYGALLADDAVIRVAGVPRALGGVTQGREAILDNFRQLNAPGGDAEIRSIFADDSHVCAIMKIAGSFAGNQYFRGNDKPFNTYEALVFDIQGGRIAEQTVYMNFLDVYVQAGLVPLSTLTSQG